MTESGEKVTPQGHFRPSLSFTAYPSLASSFSQISSPPSHDNITKNEGGHHVGFFFQQSLVKKQCAKCTQTQKTSVVKRLSNSTDSIFSTEVYQRQDKIIKFRSSYKQNQVLSKEISKSYPLVNIEFTDTLINAEKQFPCSCKYSLRAPNKDTALNQKYKSFNGVVLDDEAKLLNNFSLEGVGHDTLLVGLKEKCKNTPVQKSKDLLLNKNPSKELIRASTAKQNQSNRGKIFSPTSTSSSIIDDDKSANGVVKKKCCLKIDITNAKSNCASPKVFFPNSVLLYPFPSTPVEKCFSPKAAPSPTSPCHWRDENPLESFHLECKKTLSSKFEFGTNFLRRFSLTQITS